MSDKQKKFQPSMGWIVAINYLQVALDRVSKELEMDPIKLGQALDRAGYQLEPDPFNFMSDTWKLFDVEQREAAKTKLEVVE